MKYGWKFLTPYGATEYNGTETIYPLPQPGEKWGPWFEHPEPGIIDGEPCGPGGWHFMHRPDARYAPGNWWPWYCQVDGVLGQNEMKGRATRIRLRRISKRTWFRIIRLGWCSGANLSGANLRGANLRGANLRGADLSGANLSRANLSGANLRGANLRGANLRGANLRGANLRGANLRGADLSGANLSRADLSEANLRGADLSDANLSRANLSRANLSRADLSGADLSGADLSGAIGVQP